MTITDSNIKLTIIFNDPELDLEERDRQVPYLMEELKVLDEVESVTRVLDPSPPEGNKSFGGFLVGWLTTEVCASNAKSLISFLGDRLKGKPIKLKVEANGKKLEVTAYSCQELETAIQSAKDFISS